MLWKNFLNCYKLRLFSDLCQIINSLVLFAWLQMIPEKPATKVWSELSGVTKLRVPDGLVWEVGFTKYATKTWLTTSKKTIQSVSGILWSSNKWKIQRFMFLYLIQQLTRFSIHIMVENQVIQQGHLLLQFGGQSLSEVMSHKARRVKWKSWWREMSQHKTRIFEFTWRQANLFYWKCRPYDSAEGKKRAINIARLLKSLQSSSLSKWHR